MSAWDVLMWATRWLLEGVPLFFEGMISVAFALLPAIDMFCRFRRMPLVFHGVGTCCCSKFSWQCTKHWQYFSPETGLEISCS